MKKTTFLFLLLVLAVALSAQASLFGLEFGAKTEDVKALLKSEGFSEYSQNDNLIVFTPASASVIPTIKLTLTDDGSKLYRWTVTYPTTGNEDITLDVLAALAEIHGTVDVVDDYGMDYIWYFPGDRALYINDIGDKLLLDYTFGNWDDDDYYWYEDYGY